MTGCTRERLSHPKIKVLEVRSPEITYPLLLQVAVAQRIEGATGKGKVFGERFQGRSPGRMNRLAGSQAIETPPLFFVIFQSWFIRECAPGSRFKKSRLIGKNAAKKSETI